MTTFAAVARGALRTSWRRLLCPHLATIPIGFIEDRLAPCRRCLSCGRVTAEPLRRRPYEPDEHLQW